jgi:hypothetical protein
MCSVSKQQSCKILVEMRLNNITAGAEHRYVFCNVCPELKEEL